MTYEEAVYARNYFKQKKNKPRETDVLERLIFLSQDPHERELYMLDAAKNHVELDNFEQAQTLYGTFKGMYPGSEFLLDALVGEIKAWQGSETDSMHDQITNEELFKLSIEFFKNYASKVNEQQLDFVKDVFAKVTLLLLEHHCNVMEQYLDSYDLTKNADLITAAEIRFKNLVKMVLVPAAVHHERFEKFIGELPGVGAQEKLDVDTLRKIVTLSSIEWNKNKPVVHPKDKF